MFITIVSLFFLLTVSVIVFLVMMNFTRKQIQAEIRKEQEQFLMMAKAQFSNEQDRAANELQQQKQAVEHSVNGLKEQLDKYRQVMHEFEKDRDTKYGNLSAELKNASEHTLRLQETTNRLNDILGNVKLRGQWGERMAEDIIRSAGLMEGINFKKQKQLGSSSTKPDYTFLLPNNHIVNMDVKFPLDNYLRMVNARGNMERMQFEKDFIRNVKDRIKEIQSRDYINPAESTLDFVMLFIPNEQVFGLVQEISPEIMDEALKQKVVLCSPFTLYAMLSVIRQAYENFRFERDLQKIIAHIELFTRYFEKFKNRFEGIGKAIAELDKKYSDVNMKDFKKLDTKIRHIEQTKKGSKILSSQEIPVVEVVDEETDHDVAVS